MRNRSTRAWIVSAAVGAALTIVSAAFSTSSQADNWGSTGAVSDVTNVSFGNNDTHKVDLVSVTAEMATGVRDILAYYSFVTGGDLAMIEVDTGTADVLDYFY